MQDLAHIRRDYRMATLDVAHVDADPVKQFEKWLAEALHAQVLEPNAMHLATVDESGRPAGRLVLLKAVEENRFLFFTNYQSRKGKELETNPACALTFFWPELERQVRIEGVATRVSPERSDMYFRVRPRESQVGAWVSPQSTVIGNRALLESRHRQIEERFQGQSVLPRPRQWGGFAVQPIAIEFWQGGPGRLHDRILYVQSDGGWNIQRLAP